MCAYPRPVDGALRDAVSAALGALVTAAGPVHGGDTATAYRVSFSDGNVAFVKTHRSPPSGFFTTEAASLTWLREPRAAAVPAVLAVSDGGDGAPAYLALEWVDEGRPGPDTDGALGPVLAALHRAGAPCFGRSDGRTTGSLALPNDPSPSWTEFYASRRLLPLARIATERRSLPPSTIAALERVADRLAAVGGPPEAPARLHGDLWAGNRLVDGHGRNWLVDPAAHGGHREFDLAMMRLFGGFGPSCFAAYEEAAPLTDGWRDRIALHQIAPLVVHAIKFGGGYVSAATAAIDRYA
jgi:fructosamine-3-kinase